MTRYFFGGGEACVYSRVVEHYTSLTMHHDTDNHGSAGKSPWLLMGFGLVDYNYG